jgi:translation initiation factor 2D
VLEQTKYSNGSVVYTCQGEANPVLFSPDGKEGSIFPTVYSLWKCPGMMPTIHMYWQVSDKIIKGADLMLPGVIVPPSGDLGKFSAGDPCAILAHGNPTPFAVGIRSMSSEEVKASGMKGQIIQVHHCYGDVLYKQGDKSTPNEGYEAKRVNTLEEEEEEEAEPVRTEEDYRQLLTDFYVSACGHET